MKLTKDCRVWPKQHSVNVVALQCVGVARLNYISQKSLSCMFLIRVSPERDSPVRFEEWKWSSSHVVAHTHCHLSSLRISVKQQPGLQLFHLPYSFSSSKSWAWHMFSYRINGPSFFLQDTQPLQVTELTQVSVSPRGLQLLLMHTACFALPNLPPTSSSWPPVPWTWSSSIRYEVDSFQRSFYHLP